MSRTRSAAADSIGAAADASLHPKRRQEQPACAHPLLTRTSSSSSASSSDSGRNPRAAAWRPRGPSRPAVVAESPRVSAFGRVLFRGLERCSSTPASAAIGPRRPRPWGMERSYSTNVRVDPVINVFGFGLLFMPSSPAKERGKYDPREARLDNYYWFLGLLCFISFVIFTHLCRFYGGKDASGK